MVEKAYKVQSQKKTESEGKQIVFFIQKSNGTTYGDYRVPRGKVFMLEGFYFNFFDTGVSDEGAFGFRYSGLSLANNFLVNMVGTAVSSNQNTSIVFPRPIKIPTNAETLISSSSVGSVSSCLFFGQEIDA